jgi:hypothetical protein
MLLAPLACALAQQAVPFPQPVLTTPEGYPPVGFGGALSIFEETLIIGDGYAFSGDVGRAFAFRRTDAGHWLPTGVLEPSLSVVTGDVGVAVAAGSGLAVVGAPSSPQYINGRAHVFQLAGGWQQTQVLTGSQASLGDEFAKALALDGDRLIVGAPSADIDWADSGAAYLFERGLGGTWQEVELFHIEGAAFDSYYGEAVDVDGERLVIGAPGFNQNRVEVYARVGDAWIREALLTEPSGDADARFGASVALSGDRLAVGAPNTDGAQGAAWQGSVSIYTRTPAGDWVLEETLLPSQPTTSDQFGTSVDLVGERLVVGAPYSDVAGPGCGAVFLYHFEGGQWVEDEQLLGPCDEGQFRFGDSVALSQEALIAGGKGPSFADFAQPYALVPHASLAGWPDELSVAAGGSQQLRIDVGPAQAGQLYLTLGSSSGTAPGTPVDGVEVPLVADGYSLVTLGQANSGPFVDTLGVLDDAGRAEPSLLLPAQSDPALAGALLHHAALVFDAGGVQAVAATAEVGLALLP